MREVSKEMREFLEDLQVFANHWVDSVQQVIVDHIEELFEDKAIVHLAKEYRKEKERNDHFNRKTLLDAYEYEIPVHSFKIARDYTQALYELCYCRYVKGDKNEA